ncbi:MAG TPA: polysaccharide biosynthesis/export family protein [Bacteroidia bacterium]|jgi:polysaccharide export outer membrane protein|nr:polysaccharide biosynthesis/export family protein [Bacteroidia bacterium]
MQKFIVFILVVFTLSSCRLLRPDIMLKTPRNYVYSPIKDSSSVRESQIAPNDIIEFRLFSNDGFKLIDLTSISGTQAVLQASVLQYLVENDGTAKLPVLGSVKLEGFSIRAAETMLEEKYSQYYVKPYILLKVTNKRIILFPGTGSAARVITITNNHTSLLEVLAIGGGLPEYAKAYKIKVIRGDPQKPTVYLIDLSKIQGVAQGSMVMQANDIIYVEPRFRLTNEVLKEISPAVSLLGTAILVYTIYLQTRH